MAITYMEDSLTDKALKFTLNGLDMNKEYIVRVDCEILNDPITPSVHPKITKDLPFKTANIPVANGTLAATNRDINGYSSVYYEYTISSIEGIIRADIAWCKQGSTTEIGGRSVPIVTNGNNTGGATAFDKDTYYEFRLKVDYGDGYKTIASCVAMPNPTKLSTCTLAFVRGTANDVNLRYTITDITGISSASISWTDSSGLVVSRNVPISRDNTVTIGGMESNCNYEFKLTAYYASGEKITATAFGNTSSTPIVSTPHTVSLSKSGTTTSSISVSWNTSDGSNVTSLSLQYKPSASSSWTITTVTGSTSKTITGLNANTNYDFKLTAQWRNGTGDVNSNYDTLTTSTSAEAVPTSKTINFDTRNASVSEIQSMLAKLGDTGRSGFSKSGSYIAGKQDNWCTYSPTNGCSDFGGTSTDSNATEAFPSSALSQSYRLAAVYEYYKNLGTSWYISNAPTVDTTRGTINATQHYRDSEGYEGDLDITWHESVYLSKPVTSSYWHFAVARDYYWTARGTVSK